MESSKNARFCAPGQLLLALPIGFLCLILLDALAAPRVGAVRYGYLTTAHLLAAPSVVSGSGWDSVLAGPTVFYLVLDAGLYALAAVLLTVALSAERVTAIVVGLSLPQLVLPVVSYFTNAGGIHTMGEHGTGREGYYTTVIMMAIVLTALAGGVLGALVPRLSRGRDR